MRYIRIQISKEEKLLPLITVAVVSLLIIYITMLNMTISENFREGEFDRQIRITRQDIQDRKEVFMASLSDFYDQYSASFEKKEIQKQEFVSRESNFALYR